MRLSAISIRNYRRLQDVTIELDKDASIFVGANNSGKTSATHVLRSFLGRKNDREPFTIYDFSADCWTVFDRVSAMPDPTGAIPHLPVIGLDLWFDVDDKDLVHIRNLLPSLDWNRQPIGVRLEYAPENPKALIENYRAAYQEANARATAGRRTTSDAPPWPASLTEYLRRRLTDEYKVRYYVLDRASFDEKWCLKSGCTPSQIATAKSAIDDINTLIRVDFLNAQRHLSDSDEKSRSEDLSQRLSRFYQRNLQTNDTSFEAERALARSETELNTHLATVFNPLLTRLRRLGYPGLADPHLVVQAALQPDQIISRSPSVHYSLAGPGGSAAGSPSMTLPDRYNGLGFKNLIYMIIEMLDFHARWEADEDRAALHLLVIEEPEAHLHAQLQQVFIQQISSILPTEADSAFATQTIVTTHSSHIVYAKGFEAVRYFQRLDATDIANRSKVLNLSHLKATDDESHEFLKQYMKLTHCDLFFADAAALVEGNVERLLLPLMIEHEVPELNSRYISVLEIGGAHGQVFKNLVHFLGMPTLIITDLDSVEPSATGHGKSCAPDAPDAVTKNLVLSEWIPGKKTIADLNAATEDEKAPKPTKGEAYVRVAYQTPEVVRWNGEERALVGRTLEIAFAYRNLEWCQHEDRHPLGMRVRPQSGTELTLDEAAKKIHDRVTNGNLDKTDFALALMAADVKDPLGWHAPTYIVEGLRWLLEKSSAAVDGPKPLAAENPPSEQSA